MLKHQAYVGSTSVFDCIRTTVPAAVLTGMAAEKQPHSTQKCVNGNKPIQRKYLSHIYSMTQQSKYNLFTTINFYRREQICYPDRHAFPTAVTTNKRCNLRTHNTHLTLVVTLGLVFKIRQNLYCTSHAYTDKRRLTTGIRSEK